MSAATTYPSAGWRNANPIGRAWNSSCTYRAAVSVRSATANCKSLGYHPIFIMILLPCGERFYTAPQILSITRTICARRSKTARPIVDEAMQSYDEMIRQLRESEGWRN